MGGHVAQTRIKQEAGATAILCLQSDLCHEAMHIDWPAIRAEAVSQGVIMTRVAVRDFDHNDQVRSVLLPRNFKTPCYWP